MVQHLCVDLLLRDIVGLAEGAQGCIFDRQPHKLKTLIFDAEGFLSVVHSGEEPGIQSHLREEERSA